MPHYEVNPILGMVKLINPNRCVLPCMTSYSDIMHALLIPQSPCSLLGLLHARTLTLLLILVPT